MAEAWRKEVHSPSTHVHKWWAQRLGVVNRHLLLAAASSTPDDMERLDLGHDNLNGVVVYDPFCGSGGALLEAAKLGARVIARDVNPVAVLATRQALQAWDPDELQRGFDQIVAVCDPELRDLYIDRHGRRVVGFFWVAVAVCGTCDEDVDLFHRHVFAQHTHPRKHPTAHGICRECEEVVQVDLSTDEAIRCGACGAVTPFRGAVRTGTGVRGTEFGCSSGHSTQLAASAKRAPIRFRMYAKACEQADKRIYAPTDSTDIAAYAAAGARLRQLGSQIVQPAGVLESGHNTNQVLRVGLSNWQDFYNDRQLLALGLTATAIRDLDIDTPEREALAAAFSKSVEFNNMLVSYKGEGTGAARGAFHNHILQFERMPYETNLWSAGSGGFHASYKRLRKALQFKTAPTDLTIVEDKPGRVAGRSHPVLLRVTDTSSEVNAGEVAVTCGDSGRSPIPDGVVDVVLTDPPHFDKVNYSELADFFHAWLSQIKPFATYPTSTSTRSRSDVQDDCAATFEEGLARVWKDVERTLKPDGIVVFSFHHRDARGWKACMGSLRAAGLCVTYLQMLKAEMANSLSKKNQRSPHSMDVLVICRKQQAATPLANTVAGAVKHAHDRIHALVGDGAEPLAGDARSVMLASVLSLLTNPNIVADADDLIAAANLHAAQAEQRLLDALSTVRQAA